MSISSLLRNQTSVSHRLRGYPLRVIDLIDVHAVRFSLYFVSPVQTVFHLVVA